MFILYALEILFFGPIMIEENVFNLRVYFHLYQDSIRPREALSFTEIYS